MKAKDYLGQAYRLDQRINANIAEVQRLRLMSESISSPSWGEKVSTTKATDPPFARSLIKIMDLEQQIDAEVAKLIELKAQIRDVIDAVPDTDEQMVLRYRCLLNYSFERIGDLMCCGKTTAWAWYNKALTHVVLPEEPIVI